jgi:hypothetical protein
VKPNANGPGWLYVENGTYVADEERASVVLWIFQRAYAGLSPTDILEELEQQKIPPINDRARQGGGDKDRWKEKDIHDLLTNPLVYGGNGYPTVVTKSHFDDVQLMRENAKGGQQRSANLFAGLLFCATCGAALRLRTYKKPFRRIIECSDGHTGKWAYADLEARILEDTFGHMLFIQTPDPTVENIKSRAEKKALLVRQRHSGLIRRSIYRIEVGDGAVRVGRRPKP